MSIIDEFKHYVANKDEFVRKYEGKYLVLKDKKVLGIYNTKKEAIVENMKNHKLGTFLVHYVTEDDPSLKPAIFSRAHIDINEMQ